MAQHMSIVTFFLKKKGSLLFITEKSNTLANKKESCSFAFLMGRRGRDDYSLQFSISTVFSYDLKLKVKIVSMHSTEPCHECLWGNEGVAPDIHNLDINP